MQDQLICQRSWLGVASQGMTKLFIVGPSQEAQQRHGR